MNGPKTQHGSATAATQDLKKPHHKKKKKKKKHLYTSFCFLSKPTFLVSFPLSSAAFKFVTFDLNAQALLVSPVTEREVE